MGTHDKLNQILMNARNSLKKKLEDPIQGGLNLDLKSDLSKIIIALFYKLVP